MPSTTRRHDLNDEPGPAPLVKVTVGYARVSTEHRTAEICNTFGVSKATLYRYLGANIAAVKEEASEVKP